MLLSDSRAGKASSYPVYLSTQQESLSCSVTILGSAEVWFFHLNPIVFEIGCP